MTTLVRFSLALICLSVMSGCQERERVITPHWQWNSPKLKSMSNYYNETSLLPDEQFFFFYDEKGRLSAYDRYIPDSEGASMRHHLHYSLEYSKGASYSYLMIVSETLEAGSALIVGRRQVLLDSELNFVRDIIHDESGKKIMRECIYDRYEGGYRVTIRQWMELYNQYGITVVKYQTDPDQNVITKTVYASHFEGSDSEEKIEAEYLLTHDSSLNPLFNLTPYFFGLNSLNRYTDSESRHNVISLVPMGCTEDCSSEFTYAYENGLVSEVTPGGLSLHKRTFEYYE